MGFSRQEYWSGLPFSFPGYLPDPGIKPTSPTLAGRFFTIELPGKLLPLTPTPLSQGYWPAVYSVEAEIETYLQSCEEFGVCPTVLGLAASMGFSRVNLYAYLRNHPETESARLLDSFRCSCASVIAEASLNRTTDNATSIFLLKNCGQGLNDRQEVELTRGIDPAPQRSAADIWEQYYSNGIELPD